jgi:RNA processing factor Prp31
MLIRKNKLILLGMDISPIDLINIESFANRVIHLFEYRKSLQEVKYIFLFPISIFLF